MSIGTVGPRRSGRGDPIFVLLGVPPLGPQLPLGPAPLYPPIYPLLSPVMPKGTTTDLCQAALSICWSPVGGDPLPYALYMDILYNIKMVFLKKLLD